MVLLRNRARALTPEVASLDVFKCLHQLGTSEYES